MQMCPYEKRDLTIIEVSSFQSAGIEKFKRCTHSTVSIL